MLNTAILGKKRSFCHRDRTRPLQIGDSSGKEARERSALSGGDQLSYTWAPITSTMAIIVGIAMLLAGEVRVHAYLDPGTGSLIYQTALALVLGLGFVLRRGGSSIVNFLKHLAGRGRPSDDGNGQS